MNLKYNLFALLCIRGKNLIKNFNQMTRIGWIPIKSVQLWQPIDRVVVIFNCDLLREELFWFCISPSNLWLMIKSLFKLERSFILFNRGDSACFVHLKEHAFTKVHESGVPWTYQRNETNLMKVDECWMLYNWIFCMWSSIWIYILQQLLWF